MFQCGDLSVVPVTATTDNPRYESTSGNGRPERDGGERLAIRENAGPTCVNVCGNVMDVSAVQELKTREPRCVNVSVSSMEVIITQQLKQSSPMINTDCGSIMEVSAVHQLKPLQSIKVNVSGSVTEVYSFRKYGDRSLSV